MELADLVNEITRAYISYTTPFDPTFLFWVPHPFCWRFIWLYDQGLNVGSVMHNIDKIIRIIYQIFVEL